MNEGNRIPFSEPELLRLSPFLEAVVVPPEEEGDLILQNYLDHQDVLVVGQGLLAVLQEARTPIAEQQLLGSMMERLGCSSIDAHALLAELIDAGILVPDGVDRLRELVATRQRWKTAGWDAAFYLHWAGRDYPFIDYAFGREPDYELMRVYLAQGSIPAKYKEYPGRPFLALPLPGSDLPSRESLAAIFEHTPTSRPQVALDAELLGAFLYFTVGQIGTKPWPDQGEFIRRTSPSGGARHPTEAYLAVLDVEGIPTGTYHYNVQHHGLDCLETWERSADLYDRVCEAAPDIANRAGFRPDVVLFFSSLVKRAMWRYRDPRSPRVIYIDVGHILSTTRCVCLGLGLEGFVGQGVAEEAAEGLLGLDGIDEGLLFVGAIAGA